MNLHSTDLDREFKDFKDSKEFAKQTLIAMFVSFVVGMIIATGLIAAALSLVN